jgi:hypothetical protein
MEENAHLSHSVERRILLRFAWVFWTLALVLGAVAVFGTRHGWPSALSHMRASGKFNVDAYIQWGEFWACAVNAVLCAGLALGMRMVECGWWNGELMVPASELRIPNSAWLWLVLILGVAGALRWARMDLSLYNDEAHTFRTYVAGHYVTGHSREPEAKGLQKWRQVFWKETFFMNKVGNNLTPYSVLGRLFYDAWKKMTHAKNGAVCETALRLPVLLAGLGSLLVMWLLMRRMTNGPVSWFALVLGAVHPWHVRYSTEARGYGLMLLGMALCFYFLQRALEDGRSSTGSGPGGWRWWMGLGAAQCLCVWSFPGAVYWLAVFNGLLVLCLAVAAWKRKAGWNRLVRLSIGLLCGGMLTLQVMLPTAVQLAEIMTQLDSLKGAMGLQWWQDALGGVVLGLRWVDSDPTNPWNSTVGRMLASHSWYVVTLYLIAAAYLCGALRWCSRSSIGMLVAVSAPLSVLLSWALMSRKGAFLHPWYVLYMVPGLLACLGMGASGWRNKKYAGAGLLLLSLSLAPWWLEADKLFSNMGKENLKGVSQVIKKEAGDVDFLLGGVFTDVDVYEPRVNILHGEKELDMLIDEARSSKRKLIVTYAREGLIKLHLPEMLTRFQDSSEFRPVAVLHGLEENQFTHRVLVWVPKE